MADGVPGVRILDLVSRDAVGTVSSAVSEATGERVAVRRLHAENCRDEGARLLFAEEARRIATLDHPFLLRVRAADPRAPVPWMVTDPVDGPTLSDAIASGAWPLPRAKALVEEFLGAWHLLEERRQFHAAPIPSRIVKVGGGWRLLTFRDVRAEDEASRLKGRAYADPAWAPPETDEGAAAVPKARTLAAWAAGSLWFALRTCKAPRGAALPTPRSASAEGRALARLLDREPLRRPHGAQECLALVASVGVEPPQGAAAGAPPSA